MGTGDILLQWTGISPREVGNSYIIMHASC